jgi:hypothetical protein
MFTPSWRNSHRRQFMIRFQLEKVERNGLGKSLYLGFYHVVEVHAQSTVEFGGFFFEAIMPLEQGRLLCFDRFNEVTVVLPGTTDHPGVFRCCGEGLPGARV